MIATSISLTSSAPGAAYGTPVELTATVTPSGATGTVTFYDGVNIIGTGLLSTTAGVTTATLTTSSLGVSTNNLPATHALSAVYGGDGTHSTSTSGLCTVTVAQLMTLATPPGFADIPDSLLAANQYAMGLYFQRILGNAKFGIVRPEVFVGCYKHGDTVELPQSPVDGYTYSREELIYLWHYKWTGGVTSTSSTDASTGVTTTVLTSNKASGPGSIWYFEAYVEQATGDVSSYVKYRVSGSTTSASMTNDGILEVFTIGVRRMQDLIVSATLPAWSELPDTDFVQDTAITQVLAQTLNRNAKLASLRHEAIFMGEYTNGQQIPLPVSPVDGYQYSYAEVTFAWCWRWCSMVTQFGDPTGYPTGVVGSSTNVFNQLQRVTASIDASGNVSVATVFYDSGEYPTNYGRITVVAMCQRKPMATSAEANAFTDIADANLLSGAFPKTDVLKALNDAIRFAALRVEYFFTASIYHDQTVPLPVSPVDGYAYSRDELTYQYDFCNTGPNTNIRLDSFGCTIDQTSGILSVVVNHAGDGGSFIPSLDGRVQILTVARRLHVQPATTNTDIIVDNGSGGDQTDVLYNGNFSAWSRASQSVADYWTMGTQSAGSTFSQVPGLSSSYGQGMSVPVGGEASILSAILSALQGDLRSCSLQFSTDRATYSNLSYTGKIYFRVRLYNADMSNSAYFEVASAAGLGSNAVQTMNLWYQVPTKGSAVANVTGGTAPIIGTYDFVPTYTKIEIGIMAGAGATPVNLTVDNVTWTIQANGSNGSVGLSGSLALAFFPAIVLSITNNSVSITLNLTLNFNDGRTVVIAQGIVIDTGLTASTTYGLELYYDEATQQIAGVTGGPGSLGWSIPSSSLGRLQALAWNMPSHVPLSASPIYFTTNAAAGAPTGGSGGGDGGCHRVDVLARERTKGVITHAEIRRGDALWSRAGWLEVLEVERLPHEDWIHADFENSVQDLPMTSGHTLTDACTGALRAYEMSPGTILRTPVGMTSPTRIERKHYLGEIVRLRLAEPCTYYVSMNGEAWIESHNSKVSTL